MNTYYVYDVSTKEKWDKIVNELLNNGYVWGTDFPKHKITFEEAKNNIRGKLHIQKFHNYITNRNEIIYGNKKNIMNDKIYGKKYRNVIFVK